MPSVRVCLGVPLRPLRSVSSSFRCSLRWCAGCFPANQSQRPSNTSVRRRRNRRRDMKKLLPLCAALLLAGCASMAPDYERPALPVANSWPAGSVQQTVGAASAHPVADIAWQDFIVDERLRDVVALALDNNRDLQVAALNIERARAMYQIQRADAVPSLEISGSGS